MSFFIFLLYLVCVFIRPQDWVHGMRGLPLVMVFSFLALFSLLCEKLGSKKTGLIKVPQNRLMVNRKNTKVVEFTSYRVHEFKLAYS